MSIARIVNIPDHAPKGEGLDKWPEIDAKDLASGNPVQRGRNYFDAPDLGLTCGVWDCTAFETKMGPYSVDEFMILLEGTVTIAEASGRETTVNAGESFVIPRGLECIWRQSGYVRKIFVIFEDPDRPVPAKPSADHVIKIDPAAALAPCPGPDSSLVIKGQPQWSERGLYADASGRFTVGLWATTPYERKVLEFPRHELMHFVEGGPLLSDGAGGGVQFVAGQSVIVPRGAQMGWANEHMVKKIYCILMPK